MTSAFVIVVIAVAVVGVLGAIASLLSGRTTWEAYGRDHLLKDSDLADGAPRRPRAPVRPASPAASAERDAEIRQMLDARNARRARRGDAPLDVETELARLTAPSASAPQTSVPEIDPELRAEIRELVVARNHRRARRGLPPLDVEAELEREITGLSR